MATPKLTPEQQEINDMLKERGYYPYKYYDFSKDENAIELYRLFLNKDTSWNASLKLDGFLLNKLRNKKRPDHPVTWESEYDRLATKMLFGMTNEALLLKVMDVEYGTLCEQDKLTGEYRFDSRIQKKVDDWISYCKTLDRCFEQYQADVSIWSKSAKAKKAYKLQWKELSETPLLRRDPENIVHSYCQFLENNYGINQRTKAKAKFLLYLELPNISEYKIAKKIVETSSLIR